ncbi:MAG: hypothetical protein ACC656_06010, partial [Candidatus Heimdallarchaeota archaeon]
MNMFKQISDVVNKHIDDSNIRNKSQLLHDFAIGSTQFDKIIIDLKQFDWFKYKRKEIVADIIHKSVADTVYHFTK